MYCGKCGTKNDEGDNYCRKCGSPLNQKTPTSTPTYIQGPPPPPLVYTQGVAGVQRTSGLAVASLVLGIIGISILALIFGAIAVSQTGKDPNLSGKGMAIAGLILGIIGVIAGIFVILAVFVGLSLL